MDNLTEEKSSIEVLNKDIQELKEEMRKLQSIIHDNQNKIEQIIRSAIDNIVEGNNTNYLEPFRIESLEKILEIIKNKKALIKQQKDIDTKEKEIYDKIKQYILLYIKNKGIRENKVIGSYTDGSRNYETNTYIVYIHNNTNIIKITRPASIKTIDISDKEIAEDIDLNYLEKTYDYIQNNNITEYDKIIVNKKTS
jgi:hypothetical protein